MNIAMWVLAGGVLAWFGQAFLGFNEKRNLMVTLLIGAVGGFFGGKVLAPLFTTASSVAGEFSSAALIFAVAAAAAFLFAGNLIYERWDV
jgi:uncharacterized membrane protein YeaQ/YmgE (transglycosylase-associated protein family)